MPMVWDAAAEAKLLTKIFEICDVKVSESQKQQLATVMGCTAKAITHRIAKIRNGNPTGTGGEKPKRAPTVKDTAPAKKYGKKRAASIEDDNEDGATGAITTPPPSGRAGKKRKIKKEPSEDGIQMGEDIGEGLRKAADASESEDEL